MAAWEPLSTLPPDGRRVLLTRSEGGDPVQGPDLVQVYGWMGVDGVCVIEQVLAGEPGADFVPTHWWPDAAYDKPPS